MNEKEIAQAQEVIDSVTRGTGELKPLTPVFPADNSGSTSPRAIYVGGVSSCPANSVVEESCVCRPGWGHRSWDETTTPRASEQKENP